MEKKTQGKLKWMLPGIISFLVLTVIFLNILVLKLQHQVDTLSPKGMHEALDKIATNVRPDPKQAAARSDKKDRNDDLRADSNDPDNWNPFEEMQKMQAEIEHIFSDSFGRFGQSAKYSDLAAGDDFTPRVDVDEKGDKYVLHFDLPGVDKGNVDVHVNGRHVTVSGERNDVVTQKDDAGHVVQQERRSGSFSRDVLLPESVDASKMSASSDKGVFTIVLPKTSGTKAG